MKTSIDLTAPNAVLYMLLHFPLTDNQLARILSIDEEGVRAGIAALAAEGKGVERLEVTFATQTKCWRTGLACRIPGLTVGTYVWAEPVDEYRYVLSGIKDSGHQYGYYGTMKDVIYADQLAPIDAQIRVHEPAFRAMAGYTRSPYARLLRWLRFLGFSGGSSTRQGQRVVNVEFWPDMSVKWGWHAEDEWSFTTPEKAFAWGIEWVADHFRRELGFSLDAYTERLLLAIIDERIPEKSPGRRHIALLMAHESVKDVREAGKLPFRGGIAGADSLPAAIIRTCDVLYRDTRIQDILLVNTDAHQQVKRVKIPPSAQPPEPVSDSNSVAKKIAELDLSVRTANCLEWAGIEYVRQLCERTEAQMFKIKNFGRRSLNELKDILADMGLSFKKPED